MHPAPTCSEHDLVAAVRRGDDRAFEELYERFGRRISAYVQSMVRDHGRAEDITQEVFISALRRMRDSERPIAFKPWIYEIAKNACIDDFRRTRRAQEVPIAGDDVLTTGSPWLVSKEPTPEHAVENRQQLADLGGAFRGLSDSHHKLIVMRELEGLSYAEIGDRMGMSRTVVESSLFRARRRLTEEYDDIVTGRRCEHVQAVVDRPAAALRKLGIKERRLVGRHLSHCQACRHHARLVGVDESLFGHRRLAGKLAALLPIPAWLRWRRGSAGGRVNLFSRAHSLGTLRSAQTLATVTDPSPSFAGFGRAVAAAAALVIAGAGGGLVTGLATSGTASHAAAAHGVGSAGGSASAFRSSPDRATRLSRSAFSSLAAIGARSRVAPFSTGRRLHGRTSARARGTLASPKGVPGSVSLRAITGAAPSTPSASASVGNGQVSASVGTGQGSAAGAVSGSVVGAVHQIVSHVLTPSSAPSGSGSVSLPSLHLPSGTPSAPSSGTPSTPSTPSPSSSTPSSPPQSTTTSTTSSSGVLGLPIPSPGSILGSH